MAELVEATCFHSFFFSICLGIKGLAEMSDSAAIWHRRMCLFESVNIGIFIFYAANSVVSGLVAFGGRGETLGDSDCVTVAVVIIVVILALFFHREVGMSPRTFRKRADIPSF